MIRILTLFTAFVFTSFSLKAQNVVFESDTTYASGFYNDGADIPCSNHLINNGSMTYTIKWTKTEYLPAGWESSFCDKVNCWIPTVLTKSYPLNAGEQAIMKVLARTNNNPGIGMVKINVTSPDDDNLNTNAYYVVTAQESTGISKVQTLKDVTLYPIPANEYITILVNPNLRASRLEIYNVLGQRLKSELFTSDKNNRVDLNIQELDKGMYFVRIYTTNNTVITKQFTKE
jgi:hypothetical protein